jgi:transketolase
MTDRPSLIVCRTCIGKGSPNREGKESSHGAALGAEETRLTKDAYGWPHEPEFLVPDEVRERFAATAAAGGQLRREWDAAVAAWAVEEPAAHAAWQAHTTRGLPSAAELLRLVLAAGVHGADATRKHSGRVLNVLAKRFPHLVGGSADLAGSNNTDIKGSSFVGARGDGAAFTDADFTGSNLRFGVREHAMGAIANGLDAHGSFLPYVATFLGFLDYMRPPVRLAALSHHGLICVFTHDSIGLGEDGPTHQPIEHLWTARVTPGVQVHRPADYRETAAAWSHAVARRTGPSLLMLTRQTCPELDRGPDFDDALLLRGAYVLRRASNEGRGGAPAVVLIATGSEVGVALGARERLEARGTPTRVVSMPSVEVFDAQGADYRASVLPEGPRRVAIEAGRGDGWYRFIGRDGLVIGIDTFGASGPAKELFAHFGFTPEAVADRIRAWM